MSKSKIKIEVWGKVQGVFFRKNFSDYAKSVDVTGFVENRDDGSVWAVCQGNREDLEKMLIWCHNPPGLASVSKLCYEWLDTDTNHEPLSEVKTYTF